MRHSHAAPRRRFLQRLGAAAIWPVVHATLPVVVGAQTKRPLIANLVCGVGAARDHDVDFARRRLADALYDAGAIYTDAFTDLAHTSAIESGDLLLSYTSMLTVTQPQAAAVRRFLEKGGRWFALHATNYLPADSPLVDVLGSRFVTHPPYGRFSVAIAKPSDPLLAGIQPFEVDDELYVIEQSPDVEVLLHTRWGGKGLIGAPVEEGVRPMMYRRKVGAGGVLYLALGHNNRSFDKPRADFPDQPDRRGPWDLPVYRELIKRGIEWAAQRRPF